MEKLSIDPSGTLEDFQGFINMVYGVPDDRLYSVWDLLSQLQRFAMRALKGIRQGNAERLRLNLLVSFSWMMAIGNRLHVDLQEEVFERFPGACSYCGQKPCACKNIRPAKRKKIESDAYSYPRTLEEMQEMFRKIYPPEERTLAEAGVHLAEEVGEVGEAIHNYFGEHKGEQFAEVRLEMADFISCIFGIANSAGISISQELSAMYRENCHVCHHAPCDCTFRDVVKLKI